MAVFWKGSLQRTAMGKSIVGSLSRINRKKASGPSSAGLVALLCIGFGQCALEPSVFVRTLRSSSRGGLMQLELDDGEGEVYG